MQKLLRRFHNLSLSQKMVSAFFALLLVICLVMLAALNISFGIYDQNLYEKSLQSLDFFARQVSDELEDVESFTYDLAVSPELQQQLSELKTLAFGTSAYDYARYQLRVQLIQEARTHPIVKNIRFIDTNGSEMLVGTDTGPMDTASMLEALHQAYGAYLLTSPTAEYPYLVGGRDIRKHIDSSMEYLGSCLVTCDAAGVIRRELQGMTSSPGTLYVAAGDTMVYRGAEVDPPAVEGDHGYRVWRQDGQSYFVCWMTDPATGWLYLNIFPYSQIFGQTMALRFIVLGVFVALFVVGGLVMRVLARLITRPLARLSASMKVVESDDFEAALAMLPDHPYRDETGQLTGEFRVMLQQIDTLIRENYKKQILLQQTQYQMLQAQINPHFLNNTLEIINWEARLADDVKVCQMLEALSTMLNAAMDRKHRPLIHLSEEMMYVDAYLFIIRERLGKRLTVEKEISPETLDCYVPRLVLQPLLENAVEHGINPVQKGTIIIRAYREQDRLLLEIENDGVTTYDDLMKIQTLLSDEPLPEGTGSASLGIRNVHERVKIIYGQESGLSITITEKGNTLSRMNIKFEQDGQ